METKKVDLKGKSRNVRYAFYQVEGSGVNLTTGVVYDTVSWFFSVLCKEEGRKVDFLLKGTEREVKDMFKKHVSKMKKAGFKLKK
jgi:hypothetical protein